MKTMGEASHNTLWLIIDTMVGVLSVAAFAVVSTVVIQYYNYLATSAGFKPPIPLCLIIDKTFENYSANGLWFSILIATILLPTVVSVVIYLSAGINSMMPLSMRDGLALQIENTAISDVANDGISWRVAFFDTLTGLIFFVLAALAILEIALWVSPAIGEAIYWSCRWLIGHLDHDGFKDVIDALLKVFR